MSDERNPQQTAGAAGSTGSAGSAAPKDSKTGKPMPHSSHSSLTRAFDDAAGEPIAWAANVDGEPLVGRIAEKTPVALAANSDEAPLSDETPRGAVSGDATQGATVTYADAGVDTAEGARSVQAIKGAVHRTARPEVVGDIGGFGGLFSIAAAKSMADPLLVSGTDGVGTKLALAQRLGVHGTVGVDLVAMCANDVLACGAEPLFFLDYLAIGQLSADKAAAIVGGVADGCEQAGCALIGGEMAEHPGVMAPDDYDLSGFCVGLVDRPAMIDASMVRQGDVLLGMASSGFHSNGFSLIRKVMVEGATDEELNAPRADLDGRSIAQALLAPTRIYVKPVLAALHAHPGAVHGIAHITGGGITENLDRVLPADKDALVDLASWTAPAVMKLVCQAAHLPEAEALKTFNMGLGMILVVEATAADSVAATLREAGETVRRVGAIVGDGAGVVRYDHEGALLG